MQLNVETLAEKQPVLIVTKNNYPFISLLKQQLKKYGAEVFSSSLIPKNLDKFNYCFIVNETIDQQPQSKLPQKKIVLIFYNQPNLSKKFVNKQNKNIKIINLIGDVVKEDAIDRLLWFSFSLTHENYLNLRLARTNKLPQISSPHPFKLKKLFTYPRLIIFVIILFLLSQLAFIIPLGITSYLNYQAAKTLHQENFSKTKSYISATEVTLNIAKKIYSFFRPGYLFFSSSILPDNLIDINNRTREILSTSTILVQNGQSMLSLMIKKDKSYEEKNTLALRVGEINNKLNLIQQNLSIINQKIPKQSFFPAKTKSDLTNSLDTIIRIRKIFSYLPEITGKYEERKYLLLFANNMELRPGGGFIGSFGIIKFKDMTLTDLKIYDVYDADGQLIAHIEPPPPIRNYLKQPHWFLRDSAFSADFLTNYSQAKFFLEKELGINDFSGGILITTSAVKDIIATYGNIYLPDFNEVVNDQNFYLKAQVYAEKNFFPGSLQKKSFLGTLTRYILINLENVSPIKLLQKINKSLDEKQLVVYLDDPQVQEMFDTFYWSGRFIEPSCPQGVKNCINDFIYPIDANLGVNKANFFISRLINSKIYIDSNGKIKQHLSIQFKNDSPSDVFPGGLYRNYFQIIIPKLSTVSSVTKDGVLVEDLDQKDEGESKTVGFLFELKPKTTTEIKINYELVQKLSLGRNIYQFIVQKQTGSSNNDLIVNVSLPKNVSITNQNFSPLVKDNQIIYNTNLSADKIFIIELIKKN